MGRESAALPETTGIQTFQAGYVTDDWEKARAYSAADLFISTSRADNLPLVLQESLACGTPMLATRVGGTEDLVRHGLTGFTSATDNLSDLSQLLAELIQNKSLRQDMATRCRQIAVEEYAMDTVARKYETLYESMKSTR
jgi:glycosyltransferase involved in cell wall biosynthesis